MSLTIVIVKLLSHVLLFETPWTVAHQAPPSIEFSRQEYWSDFPFPSPGDFPDSGKKQKYSTQIKKISIRSHYEENSEKAMSPHSSTLVWKIPWMEEPGGL